MQEYNEAHPNLKDHPLFNGSKSVAFISGESPRWANKLPFNVKDKIEKYGHKMLGDTLKGQGLHAEETEGKYGTPERSYIVYGATKDQIHNLANKFGQDSYIYAPAGFKTAKLHYSDLAEDENGSSLKGASMPALGSYAYHPSEQPEDYYSKLPGKGYMRLNFDWDKAPLFENITKAEIKTLLLQALKKSLKGFVSK